MKRKSFVTLILTIAIIIFLAVVAVTGIQIGGYVVKPLGTHIKQGLDLKGGIDIVEEIQESNVDDETVNRTVELIRERVDKFGVIDPSIQKEGNNRIRIQIPGMYDQQKAIDFIGKTGELKFVGPDNNVILTGKDVKDAIVTFDQYNKPQINLTLNDSGKTKFADATEKYVGKQIAIYLDDNMISNPVVNEKIPDGNAVIAGGNMTQEEAKRTAQLIKSGALPVTLKVASVKTTGPSLGSDALQKSILAGIIGISLVMIFMLIFYRLPGLIADIALVVYMLIVTYVYIGFKVTLSLSGISGFLLSIGMAVDANVLIFERIKEELKTGKTLKASLDSGFHRALTSIIDSNVTTLIAAIVLSILGTGPIKGFAVTLTIGILASMFSPITVTRFLLKLVVNTKKFENTKLYGA